VAENATMILKVLMLGMCILVVAAASVGGSEARRSRPLRGSRFTLANNAHNPADPGASAVQALDWSAGTAAACETPPISPPDVEERNRLAKRFLAERLQVWKQRMQLESWQISIVLSRSRESYTGSSDQLRWNKANRSAIVSVLDASQYYLPFDEMLTEMEATLVQELVRLGPRSRLT
jgi:hypothetical protein